MSRENRRKSVIRDLQIEGAPCHRLKDTLIKCLKGLLFLGVLKCHCLCLFVGLGGREGGSQSVSDKGIY